MKNKSFVISVAFANYLKDKSGVPKVMMAHQNMYNQAGISYVGLFSVKKNICKDRIMLFCKFGLIIDGEFMGIFQMSQLLDMFTSWCQQGHELLDIHIHHLLYVNRKRVEELFMTFPNTPIKVYLHDYYYACSNYMLLKNQDTYCGGKGLSQECCTECDSFKDSVRTEEKIHALFSRYRERMLFISPSETTKRIFLQFHPEYAEQVRVIPHQKAESIYRENLKEIKEGEKIRVAYLGREIYFKGWDVWNSLVENALKDSYEFIVFNSSKEFHENMEKVEVAFSPDHLNAMTDALREKRIHVALLWALWPETYSYTCQEACSANAYLFTNRVSGNITDVVNRNRNGLILDREEELFALFQKPEKVRDLVNEYRRDTCGGPDEITENDEIVRLSWTTKPEDRQKYRAIENRIVNRPLLWFLNMWYKRREKR